MIDVHSLGEVERHNISCLCCNDGLHTLVFITASLDNILHSEFVTNAVPGIDRRQDALLTL